MNIVSKIVDRSVEIAGIIGASIMLLIMVMVSADVLWRNAFHRPISGVDELAQYGLLYSAFLMAAWVMKRDMHAKIDLLINKLKPKAHAIAYIIIYIVCAGICLLLAWFGGKVVIEDIISRQRETSLLMTPSWIVIIIIPVGYLLIFTQVIRAVGKYFKELSSLSMAAKAGNIEQTVEEQRFNNN